MYIIDHTKSLIKKFNKKELASFLNNVVIKKRYLVCATKIEAKDCAKFILTGEKSKS